MPSDSITRWAILIGINRYHAGSSSINLEGCITDVQETKLFLQSSLQIPAQNIDVLTASVDGEDDTQLQPTRKNVIEAIQNLPKKAKPGDFVYIHYSGHGDRLKTIYTDRKREGTSYDEVLCTLEEDIRDVEFGDLLESLGEQGLFVCVVLDSCYSGSATRYRTDSGKVRCRSVAVSAISAEIPKDELWEPSGTRGGQRNMTALPSWFDQPKSYNLIAACQPDELAKEIPRHSKKYGALTYYLIQLFQSFQSSKTPVTYDSLLQILEPKIRSKGLKQRPMHLGNKNLAIFGTSETTQAFPHGIVTSVSSITLKTKTVRFTCGSASQVGLGDLFRIYSPTQVYMGLVLPSPIIVPEVVIKSVGPLESEAILHKGSLENVKVGWPAQMYRRAKRSVVDIKTAGDKVPSQIMASLKQSWKEFVDPFSPINLRFGKASSAREPDFTVHVWDDLSLQVFDKRGQKIPHLPSAKISDQVGVKKLMYLLWHLSLYRMVEEMTGSNQRNPPSFKFDVQQIEQLPHFPDPENYLSFWKWRFKNKGSRVLFITIFNLSSGYGIHQLHPSQNGKSEPVEPGVEVLGGIGITIPSLLQNVSSRSGFQMKDKIKVFVTTEGSDFSHFEMDDLTSDVLTGGGRTAKSLALEITSWHVNEKEIISTI